MSERNQKCKNKRRIASSPSLDPIIDNGSLIQLGINPEGNLNVPGGVPTPPEDTTDVGLRYIPNILTTGGEATANGCLCEGWGVANADAATGIFTASANLDFGIDNLVVLPGTGVTNNSGQSQPDSVGSAFRSVVRDGDSRVEVTHDFNPSAVTANLYAVTVTIRNTGTDPIGDLRYRRVMDWDVPPTIFNEWVRIHVGNAAGLMLATTDGFESADPLSSPGPDNVGSPPTTLTPGSPDYFGGPDDQGALFDFAFGSLAPGRALRFTIFYGAAANESEAFLTLSLVEAEVYSLGYPTDANDQPATNGPNVFIFAFTGITGADLVVNKAAAPDPVRVGQILHYTVTVDNTGPSDATDVIVTDTLPAGVSFLSAASSQGACTEADGVVTCSLGTLPNGATATIEMMVIPNKKGKITNTVTATTTTFNDDPDNNTATITSTVLPSRK
ncbi:DUF11 domain-containing protein [Paenibacillus sp. N4]|uniref:DUF11 domain-containing protein n=1 Tax=Paenibacillus vietnamensis TaxID=2590547 RepID=UPI001CD0577B|nr:DUF11 domain-containing protein [Paenibacillus vietnamensis]MCA0753619.1 DUF11 domain-containing protein [Paenibacillus vietnamensis]